jgi:hypothetical protein
VIRHRNFLAHDPEEKCVDGDYVSILPCEKMSKRKYFTLHEIDVPAKRFVDPETQIQHTQAQVNLKKRDRKKDYNALFFE